MKLTVWEPFRDLEQFMAQMGPAQFWPAGRALPEIANARLAPVQVRIN